MWQVDLLPYFPPIPLEFQFYGGEQLHISVVIWLEEWLLLDLGSCVTPVRNNKPLWIWQFVALFYQTKCTFFSLKILVQLQ